MPASNPTKLASTPAAHSSGVWSRQLSIRANIPRPTEAGCGVGTNTPDGCTARAACNTSPAHTNPHVESKPQPGRPANTQQNPTVTITTRVHAARRLGNIATFERDGSSAETPTPPPNPT